MPPHTNSEPEGREKVHASTQSGDLVNEGAQAQMLLAALRNVIVPLAQMAAPNQKDLHDALLGPEAEDFIIALRKYISSVIRDRSQTDSEIGMKETSTKFEEPSAILQKTQEETYIEETKQSEATIKRTIRLEGKPLIIPQNPRGADVRFLPTAPLAEFALNQALTSLRAHVFTSMPVRLLCFDHHGSSLDITLLDRSGIYAHLASKLRDRLFESDALGFEFHRAIDTAVACVPEIATYSILSHTWLLSSPCEVTFSDWHSGTQDFDMTHPGYRKLVNFCRVSAEEHAVTLGWMDTVCIDKASSAELDESIRSMYKWYQHAKVCLIHLADTTNLDEMPSDAWFTRGWTLQELLAPTHIAFYSTSWTALGNGLFHDKHDVAVQDQITAATSITAQELLAPPSATPISRRMYWAARREVTRGEDAAYSLMGVFNVSIAIAYGEGADAAFTRLVKEILNTAKSEVIDVFNWAGPHETRTSALIPASPAAYLARSKFDFSWIKLLQPLTLTHLGLRVPVVLMSAILYRPTPTHTPKGDYSSIVNVDFMAEYAALGDSFFVLGRTLFDSPFFHEDTPLGLAFAVLNCVGGNESDIRLFANCFAIAILYSHHKGLVTPMGYKRKVPTKDPIVFHLFRGQHWLEDCEFYTIPRRKLERHGMQLVTMYL